MQNPFLSQRIQGNQEFCLLSVKFMKIILLARESKALGR